MWEPSKGFRFVVLASGEGTNARAIFQHQKSNPSKFNALGLISDRPAVGALAVAQEFNLPTKVVAQAESDEMQEALDAWKPDWALLAGYKKIVGKRFLHRFKEDWGYRVINIHPSLLPEFPGLHSYRRAFEAGVKESGVTVHLVDEGVDTGPILLQERFARSPADSLESFEAKGRAIEKKIYPAAMDFLASGKFSPEKMRKK